MPFYFYDLFIYALIILKMLLLSKKRRLTLNNTKLLNSFLYFGLHILIPLLSSVCLSISAFIPIHHPRPNPLHHLLPLPAPPPHHDLEIRASEVAGGEQRRVLRFLVWGSLGLVGGDLLIPLRHINKILIYRRLIAHGLSALEVHGGSWILR